MSSKKQVAIIGGGIAGISAARYLQKNGISFTLFEKSENLGGRIKTFHYKGFLLDHGFQVLLDNYEEVHRLIDFEKLKAHNSPSGAQLMYNGKWHKMGNPLKNIGDTWSTLMNPVGSLKDKWLIFKLSQACQKKKPWSDIADVSTFEFLRSFGFSEAFITGFFKPFFGGVFLNYELETSARLFVYLFAKFSEGNATLPKEGMGQLIKEIARPLNPVNLQTRVEVDLINGKELGIDGHKTESFSTIIDARNRSSQLRWNGTKCYYFSSDAVCKKDRAYLHLNPSGSMVRHICFLNKINPNYSPAGKDLLSVTVAHNTKGNEKELMQELQNLFPGELSDLQFLKAYDIPQALPVFNGEPQVVKSQDGIITIGDSVQYPSINGAVASGRMAAELIIGQENTT